MSGHPWTALDREAVRREYGLTRLAVLAARLGRTVPAVKSFARRCGAKGRRPPVGAEEARRLLVPLHSRGLSDRECAARLGWYHRRVGYWRGRLGLPANRPPGWSEAATRARKLKAYHEGCPSHSALLARHKRVAALGEEAGCTSPWQVAAVRLLRERGPLSGPEVAAAVGSCVYTASKALAALEGAGLARRERRGRHVLWHASDEWLRRRRAET